MSTTKFATLLAVMALFTSVAVAQPAADAGTSATRHHKMMSVHNKRGADDHAGTDARRDHNGGPFIKIGLARRLDSLTPEQKTKIDAFAKESKAEAADLQKNARQAIEEARKSTDRAARREAMKSVRQKFQATEKKVDAFLKNTLTPEQQSEIQQKASNLRDRAVERMRKAHAGDNSTSGTKAGKRGDKARRGKHADAKAGKKADAKVKAGKKRRHNKAAAAAVETPAESAGVVADDGATSSSAVSPFVRE